MSSEELSTLGSDMSVDENFTGMWMIFPERDEYWAERRQEVWRRLQEAKKFNLWEPWKYNDGKIGCIFHNCTGVGEVYWEGKTIREVLGDLAEAVEMYFKPKEVEGNHFRSEFHLSKNGVFRRRNSLKRWKWDTLILPDGVEDFFQADEDHAGMWIVFFKGEERVRALSCLLEGVYANEVTLWEPEGENRTGVIGCITNDDQDDRDVYLQGKIVQRYLQDLANSVIMHYKTQEDIRMKRSSEYDDKKIATYRLSPNGEFFKREPDINRDWKQVDTWEWDH